MFLLTRNSLRWIRKLLFLVSFLAPAATWGQNLCGEVLSEAEKRFEAGRLYDVDKLLQQCLSGEFTREEMKRAYRLLTLTHLFLDQPGEADRTYLSLLKLSPEYQPNPAVDPIELFYLHEQFMTTPCWSITMGSAGLNMTFVDPYNSYTTDGYNRNIIGSEISQHPERGKRYLPALGLSVGAGIELSLSRKFTAGAEALFHQNRFKLRQNLLGHVNLSFEEEQLNLELPLYVKYSIRDGKLKPYILGGAGVKMSLMSKAKKLNISRDEKALPDSGPDILLNNIRRNMGYGLLFGVGIKYKIGINYLTCEIRQNVGLKNFSSRDRRYLNPDLLYKYMYVDDDMRMNNFLFKVSYVKPIYNPRKKK